MCGNLGKETFMGQMTFVASVVEWLVRSAAVREVAGSNPTGDNVVIPVFPPKVTCPPSSNRHLAM